MKEKGKFSDGFNAYNGNMEKRNEILKCSNKLKEMGITDPNMIDRIYKSGDFLAFHDPLKLKNLEMFGIDNRATDDIVVAEVMDRTKGEKVYQFINTGNEEKMKRGDILTLNPNREGKEAGTEFDEDFIAYCMEIVKKEIPGIEILQTQNVSDKDIMEALGIRTYEDVVYMSAKKGGFEEQIKSQVKSKEDKSKFVSKLAGKDETEKVVGADEEQEQEGMTVEEASEVLGIEEEKLREIAGDNGKILGIRKTSDVDSLSKQLGFEMSNAGSEVVMLKVAGPGIKSEGFVLNNDGSPLFSKENGDTTLITELVETGANGEDMPDINDAIREHDAESKKIETIDPVTGEKNIEFAEEGNEKAVLGYESDSKQILDETAEKIKIIEDGPGDRSDKLSMISDVLYTAKGRLSDLQVAYNISEKDNLDSLEDKAADYAASAETAKIGEVTEDAFKGAVGMLSAPLIKRREEQEEDDERTLGPANHGGILPH